MSFLMNYWGVDIFSRPLLSDFLLLSLQCLIYWLRSSRLPPKNRHRPPFSAVRRSNPLLFWKAKAVRESSWFGIVIRLLVISSRLSVRSGEGNGTPLQFSCLENPMDRGAWWAAVHGVTRSRTWLSDFTSLFTFHALEEMATHSSVLAWRIPGTGKPGGLPSVGSHRVGHDWSDLAAAAAVSEVFRKALIVI